MSDYLTQLDKRYAKPYNYEAEQEAWGKVFKGVTSANKITFYASEATEVALTLLITGSRTTS